MTVFAVLLLYWVGSGLTLAIYDLADGAQEWMNDGGGAGARTPDVIDGLVINEAGTIAEAEVLPMALATIEAAKKLIPDQSIADVELRIVDGVRQGIVRVGRGRTQRFTFNTQTGDLIENGVTVPASKPSTHTLIKSWHSGSALGIAGNSFAFAAGAALFLLSVTGIAIYLDLWRRRRRAGRESFFWK